MLYLCFLGTGGVQKPPEPCAQGHYCPLGTQHSDQYPCPAGTWTNQTNLAASAECYVCPRGSYCLAASTWPTALCPTGHYCPAGNVYVPNLNHCDLAVEVPHSNLVSYKKPFVSLSACICKTLPECIGA